MSSSPTFTNVYAALNNNATNGFLELLVLMQIGSDVWKEDRISGTNMWSSLVKQLVTHPTATVLGQVQMVLVIVVIIFI